MSPSTALVKELTATQCCKAEFHKLTRNNRRTVSRAKNDKLTICSHSVTAMLNSPKSDCSEGVNINAHFLILSFWPRIIYKDLHSGTGYFVNIKVHERKVFRKNAINLHLWKKSPVSGRFQDFSVSL